jgi:hypothetical protein
VVRSFAGTIGRLAVAGALVASLLGVAAARPATPPPTKVAIFGDSVADVLDYVPEAKQYLAQGLNVVWELRVCRRLVQLSCPYMGVRPPSVLDTVQAANVGDLGPIVVVDVGYNDYVQQYQSDMETVVQALLAKGVQHIIWTTLHEERDDYRRMNVAIRAEAAKWPQITIADFNAASQGQSWFNSDGIHLNDLGAAGLAKLLRPAILAACGDPCQPPIASTPPKRALLIAATARTIRVGAFTVWNPPGRGTYAQASATFGRASTCRLVAGKKSKVIWSTLGLSMQFIASHGSVCANPAATMVQTVTITGAGWKTSDGLTIGDALTRLKTLYPTATAHSGSYWLVKADRLKNHALVAAVVRSGRVAAFQLAFRTDA